MSFTLVDQHCNMIDWNADYVYNHSKECPKEAKLFEKFKRDIFSRANSSSK